MTQDLLKQKAINQIIRLAPFLGSHYGSFFSRQMRNPVFVIGSARSGTTILAGLLGTHRDVANWSEANDIWDPNWYPWRPSNNGKWPMEYDPDTFMARWWLDAEPRQREIRAIFGAYQWLRQKSLFLNKSPFHTFRIPYLLQMFPTARLIHLVRDGRAVVYSYSRRLLERNKLQEWPEPQRSKFAGSLEELALWLASFWKRSIEEVERQDKELKLSETKVLLEITYEELCLNTTNTLGRICRFLDLSMDRFGSGIKKRRLENQNHKWQHGFSPQTAHQIVALMEPLLTRKGYVVDDRSSPC